VQRRDAAAAPGDVGHAHDGLRVCPAGRGVTTAIRALCDMPVAIMPIHRSTTLGYRSLFASILRHFYDLHAERYAIRYTIRYAILYIVYAICS